MRKVGVLIFSILVCFLAAGVGSAFTAPAIPTWYTTLNKPFFSPPSWLFAPVWTILYFLMGVSLYLIWNTKENNKDKKKSYLFFATQLTLNTLWSIIFFGLKNPTLAFVEIIFLWIAIFVTIKSFLKINKRAGQLLFPYLAWVSFATLLNLAVALLN